MAFRSTTREVSGVISSEAYLSSFSLAEVRAAVRQVEELRAEQEGQVQVLPSDEGLRVSLRQSCKQEDQCLSSWVSLGLATGRDFEKRPGLDYVLVEKTVRGMNMSRASAQCGDEPVRFERNEHEPVDICPVVTESGEQALSNGSQHD